MPFSNKPSPTIYQSSDITGFHGRFMLPITEASLPIADIVLGSTGTTFGSGAAPTISSVAFGPAGSPSVNCLTQTSGSNEGLAFASCGFPSSPNASSDPVCYNMWVAFSQTSASSGNQFLMDPTHNGDFSIALAGTTPIVEIWGNQTARTFTAPGYTLTPGHDYLLYVGYTFDGNNSGTNNCIIYYSIYDYNTTAYLTPSTAIQVGGSNIYSVTSDAGTGQQVNINGITPSYPLSMLMCSSFNTGNLSAFDGVVYGAWFGASTSTGDVWGATQLADVVANPMRAATAPAAATTFTFTGPTTGNVTVTSTNFSVTPNDPYTGTITITPSGGGLSSPIVLTYANSISTQTFTITPPSTGTVTLVPTNNGGLTNPSNCTYVVTGPAVSPSTQTMSPGDVLQLSASGFAGSVVWSCVTGQVSSIGVYTAGTANDTITATHSAQTATCAVTIATGTMFRDTMSLGSTQTGLTLNGQQVDLDGTAVGSAITSGYVEFGGGQYGVTTQLAHPAGYMKHYASGSPGTVLSVSVINVDTVGTNGSPVTVSGYSAGQDPGTLVLATPGQKIATDSVGAVTLTGSQAMPYGVIVGGSTVTSVIVSGLPAGNSYVGQKLYNVVTGEARLINTQTYNSGNYTFAIGGGTGESLPFSSVGTGVNVIPIP